MSETGQRVQNMVFIVYIEGVGEVIWLAIDVGPQRHRFTVHFLKTEIQLENVSIGTSLVHQKQNYYYSPFQCSQLWYMPLPLAPVRCCKGMYQTDSCRGDPG